MLSTTVFVNGKIFKYWIEKNIFFDVSPKNSFLEPNLIKKPTKKIKLSSKKKCVEWFFPIQIECIGFWEHSVRYQRTLMFPIFFPFWTAYLPWTETLLYIHSWIFVQLVTGPMQTVQNSIIKQQHSNVQLYPMFGSCPNL